VPKLLLAAASVRLRGKPGEPQQSPFPLPDEALLEALSEILAEVLVLDYKSERVRAVTGIDEQRHSGA